MPDDQERIWPLTVQEAVDRLVADLKDEDKARIASMPASGLIHLHHGLGQYIRNAYGLRQGNEALLASCHAADPDGASHYILHELWRRLQVG